MLTLNSYAGVDFTMGFTDSAMSGNRAEAQMQIPYFQRPQDAIRFANKYLGDETMRRALRDRTQWFLSLSWLGSDPTLYQIEMANHYASQQQFCILAYNILTGVKNALKDKAQITVPNFTSRFDAESWIDTMKREDGLLLDLTFKYHQILVMYSKAKIKNDKIRVSLLHAQVERLYNAMQYLQKNNNVGAVFYAGEMPMPRGLK